MSITVTECIDNSSYDLINPGFENGRAELRTVYRASRYFHVDGLTETNAMRRQQQAAGAVGVPQPAEIHPENNELWVTNVSVKCMGENKAFVSVEYDQRPDSELPPIWVDIGSSVQQYECEYDYAGNHMKVTVDGKDYFGRYPTERVYPVVRVSVSGLSASTALAQAKTYNGTVSNGGPLGGADRTWRCMVTARPTGVGNTYTIDYEFAYDPNTWDMYVAYFDNTGKQLEPENVPSGDKRVQQYVETQYPPLANVIL